MAGSFTVRPLGGILRLRHADRKVAWDWTRESLKEWCLKSLRKDRSLDRNEQTKKQTQNEGKKCRNTKQTTWKGKYRSMKITN